jgi:hypothetical protein
MARARKRRRSTKTAHGKTAAEQRAYKAYRAARRKLIAQYFGKQRQLF